MLPSKKTKSGYSQIDHIVFTTHAIFVIETKNYTGVIYGHRNRTEWSLNGKFNFTNPFHQNYGHIEAVKSILPKITNENIVSVVSFNRRSTFKVNEELRKINSNDLIIYDIELLEYVTRKLNVIKLSSSQPPFTTADILNMYTTVSEGNITDKKIRAAHIRTLNGQTQETPNSTGNSTCKTCGKVVSSKVTQYCLAHSNRFKGNVYCYEHQKSHF